ncbi:hypothetical protein ACFLTK_00820 [Chloroflexota bacterium]
MSRKRDIQFKIIIIWLAIMLVGSFWLTMKADSAPLSLVVVPEVPREGEPIVATFKLSNPLSQVVSAEYQFYANGELQKSGVTAIPANSSKVYKYAYKNSLELGQQVNFMVEVISPQGSYEKVVSLPNYPPQVWSSFVSFASFSTSMMGFMSSMVYFESNFGGNMGFNVGILVIIALIGLLILMELTQPQLQRKTATLLGRLRLKFSTITWILFIIFIGMVYTKVVLIIAT